jgi:hypothetical protein
MTPGALMSVPPTMYLIMSHCSALEPVTFFEGFLRIAPGFAEGEFGARECSCYGWLAQELRALRSRGAFCFVCWCSVMQR